MPDVRLRASDRSRRLMVRATLVLCSLALATSVAAQTPARQLVMPFESATRAAQTDRKSTRLNSSH